MGSIPEKTPLDVSVAIKANDAKSVAELSNAVGSLGKDFSVEDEEGRLRLLKQTRSLLQALETPRETMIKHCWAQVSWPLTVSKSLTNFFSSASCQLCHCYRNRIGAFQLLGRAPRPQESRPIKRSTSFRFGRPCAHDASSRLHGILEGDWT